VAEPFVTREVDFSLADTAQAVYPRYVFAQPTSDHA